MVLSPLPVRMIYSSVCSGICRLDGVVVDYAVTVAVDGAGVSNEQLDYLTLQSNRVETLYRTLAARPTAVHVAESFATEVLQNTGPQSGTLTVHGR